MGLKNKKLKVKRVFSEDFKKARVKEYEKGEYTVREMSVLYDICTTVLYRWIYKYSIYHRKSAVIVEMKDSSKKKLQDLEKKVHELERALGQKQLKIDFLEKMIDLADEEFGIEIKKKSNTPQSGGSEKTNQK